MNAAMTVEVTTLSELERWRRRALIKTIEKILGGRRERPRSCPAPEAVSSGRDHHQEARRKKS